MLKNKQIFPFLPANCQSESARVPGRSLYQPEASYQRNDGETEESRRTKRCSPSWSRGAEQEVPNGFQLPTRWCCAAEERMADLPSHSAADIQKAHFLRPGGASGRRRDRLPAGIWRRRNPEMIHQQKSPQSANLTNILNRAATLHMESSDLWSGCPVHTARRLRRRFPSDSHE